MKKCLVLLFVLMSFHSFGNTEFMSVKDKLRLSLWFEGIEDTVQKPSPKVIELPEEIERSLKKN